MRLNFWFVLNGLIHYPWRVREGPRLEAEPSWSRERRHPGLIVSRWSAKAEQTGKTALHFQMPQLSRLFPHQSFYISKTVLKLAQKHRFFEHRWPVCLFSSLTFILSSAVGSHEFSSTTDAQREKRVRLWRKSKRCLSSHDLQPRVPLDEGLKQGGLVGVKNLFLITLKTQTKLCFSA